MSAYPDRSGPHQRVFNCHQAMVLSGQKSVYVVFLRNEKINLKVIILRFLSPGKKCWYHKIMKRPNFKIITVPNTISLNRPKCLIYHFISDPITHIWTFLNPQLFLCGFGFRPHVTVNPAYQSETVWIRSPEWKFSFNTLWIRNRVGRCTVTWLPNFLGGVDYFIFLPMVFHWRTSRARAPLLDSSVRSEFTANL